WLCHPGVECAGVGIEGGDELALAAQRESQVEPSIGTVGAHGQSFAIGPRSHWKVARGKLRVCLCQQASQMRVHVQPWRSRTHRPVVCYGRDRAEAGRSEPGPGVTMRLRQMSFAVLCFLVISLPAWAAGHRCAAVVDPGERLACYDQAFPPTPE